VKAKLSTLKKLYLLSSNGSITDENYMHSRQACANDNGHNELNTYCYKEIRRCEYCPYAAAIKHGKEKK